MNKDCKGCLLLPICVGKNEECRLDKGTQGLLVTDPEQLDRHQSQEVVETSGHRQSRVEQIRGAIEILKGKQMECIELRFLIGLTEDEIGKQLNISRSTVCTHIKRGITRLKKILKED